MPIVTALKDFDYQGRHVSAGDRPDFIHPVQCSILARQGLVSLTKQTYKTRDLASEPEPVPVKTKRRYRRRDLQAETE
jgi:hypothetical protein